jgi:hypothetical protein
LKGKDLAERSWERGWCRVMPSLLVWWEKLGVEALGERKTECITNKIISKG